MFALNMMRNISPAQVTGRSWGAAAVPRLQPAVVAAVWQSTAAAATQHKNPDKLYSNIDIELRYYITIIMLVRSFFKRN